MVSSWNENYRRQALGKIDKEQKNDSENQSYMPHFILKNNILTSKNMTKIYQRGFLQYVL